MSYNWSKDTPSYMLWLNVGQSGPKLPCDSSCREILLRSYSESELETIWSVVCGWKYGEPHVAGSSK